MNIVRQKIMIKMEKISYKESNLKETMMKLLEANLVHLGFIFAALALVVVRKSSKPTTNLFTNYFEIIKMQQRVSQNKKRVAKETEILLLI